MHIPLPNVSRKCLLRLPASNGNWRSRQAKTPGKCHCSHGPWQTMDYQALLKQHNLRGSMSAKGCCYDNAYVESFFHSLKVECIHGERFASREIMRTTVFSYIECDYNLWRRHSACDGPSPEQFENQTSLRAVPTLRG